MGDAQKKFEAKVDKMVTDQGELKEGINDIKDLLKTMGERLSQAEADTRVVRDAFRDFVLASRAQEYRAQVEAKLSRPATLVFSRPNGSTAPTASAELITEFIMDKFETDEAPDFIIEPMGSKGSFRLYPETYSPAESRRICATVLKAAKPNAKNNPREEDIKTKLGLNVFYDNPLFLREIRSEVLRLTAQMLQSEGLKLSGKPYVKKDVLMLNDLPMFPEYLVPPDEALWPACFSALGEILRQSPPPVSSVPLAQSVMEDLYVAGRGLIFPTLHPRNPAT
jgi:hypothetical protein